MTGPKVSKLFFFALDPLREVRHLAHATFAEVGSDAEVSVETSYAIDDGTYGGRLYRTRDVKATEWSDVYAALKKAGDAEYERVQKEKAQ